MRGEVAAVALQGPKKPAVCELRGGGRRGLGHCPAAEYPSRWGEAAVKEPGGPP